jgi:hypothetical protein
MLAAVVVLLILQQGLEVQAEVAQAEPLALLVLQEQQIEALAVVAVTTQEQVQAVQDL